MFKDTIVIFFLSLITEYVQKSKRFDTETRNTKANKLIYNKQRTDQSQYGILEAFIINFCYKVCRKYCYYS